MLLEEVRAIARTHNIKTRKIRKAELIRAIQKEEGNISCFGTANGFCDQHDCRWREDCLTIQR